jgi:flotillin
MGLWILSESMMDTGSWGIVLGVLVVLFLIIFIWASRYTKVGPNEVLVISGRKHKSRDLDGRAVVRGFRMVRGGGTFVWPVIEKVDILSLELLTLDVKTPEVYTQLGVPVLVDGVAQIKVKGDDVSISVASEQYLSKNKASVTQIALQTLEGHLRAILGTMTVEDIYQNRDSFAQKVQEVAAGDMASMGLHIVSFTIRDIRDNEGYLDALGKPRIAAVKRDAVIGQAEADRDATIKSAEANQDGQIAKYLAETKIAEANRDYSMQSADYQASINVRKAEADLAYDLQRFKTSQVVKKEEVAVEVVEKQERIKVQEQEILRKEKDLDATVVKPAEAERSRIQNIADAERYRIEAEAHGAAESAKARGFADAEVVVKQGAAAAEAAKAQGLAQAEVIQAQGEATALAMKKKADSWKQYSEAAVIQMLVEVLPEITKNISEPLSKTEKIVVVNSGGGDGGAGASKITRDVADIVAQLPPVIESLSGIDLKKLISKVPGLSDAEVVEEPKKKS